MDFLAKAFKPLTDLGKPAPKGQVLGTGSKAPSPRGSADKEGVFEVTFTEESLGMTVTRDEAHRAVVASTVTNGAAWRKGIVAGDRVVGVDGNPVEKFEALEVILVAIGRPVVFRMERAPVKQRAPTPALADGEREARREAMSRAAEERTRAWDKRLQTTKQQKEERRAEEREKAAQAMGRFGQASDEATKEVVEKVKAMEASTAESLGYNPYEPKFSSSAAAKAMIELGSEVGGQIGAGGPAPIPPLNGGGGAGGGNGHHSRGPSAGGMAEHAALSTTAAMVDEKWLETDEGQKVQDDVDGALAVFVGQDRGEAWATARSTVANILGNLIRDPQNEKFRRIRVGNPAFQSKVVSVSGALEVLSAAGFEVLAAEEEAYFVINLPPPQVPQAALLTYQRLDGF